MQRALGHDYKKILSGPQIMRLLVILFCWCLGGGSASFCNKSVDCVRELKILDAQEDEEYARHKRGAFLPYRTGKEEANQVSKTLDFLLQPSRYNKRIRPGMGKYPVIVELNMSIRAMGPVDENTQSFYLDCYFRQTWYDERLKFNRTAGISELSLDWKILSMIWKPDTFFINGKKSKLHKITVPNRFSRIAPDGKVSYSQRLTIAAYCPMSLKKFPLDSQICPLRIGSYGYPAEDMEYTWKAKPLSMDEFDMAQFKLMEWSHGESRNVSKRKVASGFRTDSIAYLYFHFERQTGYFLLQIYTPLLLIVMCSWVAFWIIKTDVPARCGLGVTTVLSVTKIGFGGKGKPQGKRHIKLFQVVAFFVPYATALDTFVIICFVSVFASVVEFAVINFITLFVSRYKACEKKEQERREKEADLERKAKALKEQIMQEIRKAHLRKIRKQRELKSKSKSGEASEEKQKPEGKEADDAPMASEEEDSSGDYIDQEVGSDELHELEQELGNGGQGLPEGDDEEGEERHSFNSEVSLASSTLERIRQAAKDSGKGDEAKATKKKKVVRFRRIKRRLNKIQDSLVHVIARVLSFLTAKPVHQMSIYTETEDVLEQIDALSRTYFPMTFLFLMLCYWTIYLYIMPDVVLIK